MKGLPFAAILGETPTKIDKAALSRWCGTPSRISPQFGLKDVAVSGFLFVTAALSVQDDNLWQQR
jgi:hypothetical protein